MCDKDRTFQLVMDHGLAPAPIFFFIQSHGCGRSPGVTMQGVHLCSGASGTMSGTSKGTQSQTSSMKNESRAERRSRGTRDLEQWHQSSGLLATPTPPWVTRNLSIQ